MITNAELNRNGRLNGKQDGHGSAEAKVLCALTDVELQRRLAFARFALVFSDEQFRQLEMPTTPALPAACDLYEKAISVAGVSKTHGLGGLRIGTQLTLNPSTTMGISQICIPVL